MVPSLSLPMLVDNPPLLSSTTAQEISLLHQLVQLLSSPSLTPVQPLFFQAEDGIRHHCVTGVQTCALPILIPRQETLVLAQMPQLDKSVLAPQPIPILP